MDRREALKRIGIGGAVAVGTTAILSSPAFAYALPSVGADPSIAVNTSDSNDATISSGSWPVGSCPTSSTNASDQPARSSITYEWTLRRSNTDGSGGLPTSGTGTGVHRPSGSWDGSEIQAGHDVLDVVVKRAYRCTYGSGSATRCVSWTRTFDCSGIGSTATWTGGSIVRNESATGCSGTFP